jgi:hypothetical protein
MTEGSLSRHAVKYGMNPVGIGTGNCSADEDQQQFSSQVKLAIIFSRNFFSP